MILCFPFLHHELALSGLPEGVLTVDPGLGAPTPGSFTPQDLPLDVRAAKGYLAESVAFGEQFASARDMAAVLRQGGSPLDPEGAGSIRAGLLDGEERARQEAARRAGQIRLHAQAALLFAWASEERFMDLSRLDAVVDEGMDRLRRSLGLDEEEPDDEESAALSAAMAAAPGDEARAGLVRSWRTVLRAMCVLAPEADFFTAEQAVLDDLREEGALFAPCPEAGIPGASCAVVPRAWLWKGAGDGPRPEGTVRVFCPSVA